MGRIMVLSFSDEEEDIYRRMLQVDALVNFAANFMTKRKESMGKCS